jgi:hypothetical protein
MKNASNHEDYAGHEHKENHRGKQQSPKRKPFCDSEVGKAEQIENSTPTQYGGASKEQKYSNIPCNATWLSFMVFHSSLSDESRA